MQRTASGGLVIEAPPETASTLAALFSGMAQLLQAAAAPPVTAGESSGSTMKIERHRRWGNGGQGATASLAYSWW